VAPWWGGGETSGGKKKKTISVGILPGKGGEEKKFRKLHAMHAQRTGGGACSRYKEGRYPDPVGVMAGGL